MNSPHVYDKAKYHYETIEEYGLAEEHASNHTVMFLRWLLEKGMMSEFFEKESGEMLARFRSDGVSAYEIYRWWDCCLVSDMLSQEGNGFARHYFDFENGRYLSDYIELLQGSLPSEFHVEYTKANYQKLRAVIDRRYQEWSAPKKSWWPFRRKAT